MATSQEQNTKPGNVMKLLGTDPWVRFDVWSSRAWEMVQKATEIAVANGAPMSSDDCLDPRVGAFFHSAEVCKEFAEMLNPIFAVNGTYSEDDSFDDDSEAVINMIIEGKDIE